jgi:MraZ protein
MGPVRRLGERSRDQRAGQAMGALREVFYSTFEKPLDAKRRLVVPQEFRALAAGPFDGVFCFPSVEADCIEGGGKALFERNEALINEFEVGDPLRYSLEFTLRGGMARLAFDTAGRVTLPEHLCDMFGLSDWVVVVGLGERFQIWGREAFHAARAAHGANAREGLAASRAEQRRARLGAGL